MVVWKVLKEKGKEKERKQSKTKERNGDALTRNFRKAAEATILNVNCVCVCSRRNHSKPLPIYRQMF